MPYEVYKLLHLAMIFLFIGSFGIGLFASENPKWNKIMQGVVSFLIFVAGMGLIARLGFPHGEPWPTWIKVKIGIWLIATILAPVFGKRLRHAPMVGYLILMFVVVSAGYVAIWKPFS